MRLTVSDHDSIIEFNFPGTKYEMNEVNRRSGGWWRILFALLVLNVVLAFGNDWPGIGIQVEPRLSVEAFGLAAALLVWVSVRGAPSQRALAVLALCCTVFVLLRYVDVTVPAVLGRAVNLYWDGRHAGQVLLMWLADARVWTVVGVLAASVAGVAALFVLLRSVLGLLCDGLERSRARPAALCMLVFPLALYGAQPWVERDTRAYFSDPVSMAVLRAGVQLRDALIPGASAVRLTPSPAFDGNLDVLSGADVVLIFAEAYGAVTFDDAKLAAELQPSRAALQDALNVSGRGVVSAMVRSPTFGGASWLAHAALLSGVDTAAPGSYEMLLSSTRPTLVSHFARHGYRTVAWMPGLQRPWPEGAFYGFARYAGARDIAYAGPAFGYWQIPDQASMALLHAQELAGDGGDAGFVRTGLTPDTRQSPRFVVFPTVSTHAPFAPVPPYLNDWSALMSENAFSPQAVAEVLSQPVSWSDPKPAYVQGMRYTFEWLTAYLRDYAPRDSVVIVVGDHQPISAVSGRDASWSVPVHVFSNRRPLLGKFEAAGFVPGLIDLPTLGNMFELTSTLLDVFSTGESSKTEDGL